MLCYSSDYAKEFDIHGAIDWDMQFEKGFLSPVKFVLDVIGGKQKNVTHWSFIRMSFLKDIVKDIGNEYAGIVSDGVSAGDVQSFIDTGSYVFNAVVSVLSLVVYPLIRSLLLQESLVQVRHSFV